MPSAACRSKTTTYDATDLLDWLLSANAAFLEQSPGVAANTVGEQEYIDKVNTSPFDLASNGTLGGPRVIVAKIGVRLLLAYVPPSTVRAAQA